MQLTSFLQIKHDRLGYEIYNTQSIQEALKIFSKERDAVALIGQIITLPVSKDDFRTFKIVSFDVQFRQSSMTPNHFERYASNEDEPEEGYEFNTVIELFVDDKY